MSATRRGWIILMVAGVLGGAPASRPVKVWERAEVVSPVEYGAGADAKITKLIEGHNAGQDRIGRAVLAGDCVWTLDMEGEPRGMSLVYEREAARGEIVCAKQECRIEGGKISHEADSAVHLDALYLLAFRKFDPRGFVEGKMPATRPGRGGAKREEGKRVMAQSEKERLEFDELSGRLMRAELATEHGPLMASFSEFRVLGGDAKAEFPTVIEVVVPAEMYPFPRPWEGKIRFKIDAGRSELNAPRARGG